MRPRIDAVHFGTITVDGQTIAHDIVISPDGEVKKRKKKLSKKVYGTSHILSLAEIKALLAKDADPTLAAKMLIIGTGHFGRVKLSPEARQYLEQEGCEVKMLPVKKAVRFWNKFQGADERHPKAIGLFHITC